MATTKRKLPAIKREYRGIVGIDSGLDYSIPSTMIAETNSPCCEEVTFRDGVVAKAYGTEYFAGTGTVPLKGTVMMGKQYVLNNESEKFILHTNTNTYVYNSTSDIFECVTKGEVVENCEDVWAVNTNATCAVSTDKRKGTYSIAVTVGAGFTTGIAAYENFTLKDLSSYTHLHLFIKSDVATAATTLDLRVSEETDGGVGASYEDVSIPALSAGVWTEVSVAFTGAAGTRNAVLSISLIVAVDIGAMVINIDDVMAIVETTGDEDNNFVAATVNNLYICNNGIIPLLYWDMTADAFATLTGGAALSCRAMVMIGERLCLYRVGDYPRRVQWTVVGGISSTPATTDWTNPGSGNTDLDSVFNEDVIMTAHRLGNYVVVYGKKTIAMQEYTGKTPDDPYAFYVRVPGVGTPSERGVANLGDSHIILGSDDIYLYRGGTEVESIGDKVSSELFSIINPTYINRSFLVYLEEQYEVRIYFPLIGSSTPNCYFSYSLKNKSWSRGSRSYSAFGSYKKVTGAETWDSIGTATTTWDELTMRWDDSSLEELAPLNIYGDTSGKVYKDNESVLNLAGVAIDGKWETKDFVVGDGYRRNVTNWMSLSFEALGDSVTVYYSTDLGLSWSEGVAFTLTNGWIMYRYDVNVNASQVRFKFRNNTLSQTFELRYIELGYVKATDRGTS